MANPKPLVVSKSYSANDSCGIEASYVKSRRTLIFNGWFDHIVGIEGVEMPLGQFLRELGITEADVRKSLAVDTSN